MNMLLQLLSMLAGYFIVGYNLYRAGSKQSSSFEVLYNIYHEDSLIFVSSILVGIALVSFGFKGILTLMVAFLRMAGADVKRKNDFFRKNGKYIAESFYKNELSILQENSNKLPRVWKKIFSNLEKKVPAKDVMEIVKNEGRKEVSDIDHTIKLFRNLSSISASVGILGTIIGLIKLFKNMGDVSTIGANMSLAFVTTLYGVLFGIVFFGPVASKMQNYKDDLIKAYMDSYYWLQLISERKPTSYLEHKK